jgi:hypothetical protein
MESLLPIIIPAAVGVLASLITALFIRRSSKEANDTNAFKVVTDQLLADNKALREETAELRVEIRELRNVAGTQDKRIETLENELGVSKAIARTMARYIGLLLQNWPGPGAPPDPEPPVEWEKHL